MKAAGDSDASGSFTRIPKTTLFLLSGAPRSS